METNLPLFTETFLGMRLLHVDDLVNLVLRFSLNTIAVLILIGLLYYRQGGRKDYFFTSMVISVTVFLLCFLLESVKIQLGFALGLFAVFGIIRYRTEQIPIKEMTYLFAAIGLSIINALANKKVSYAELLFTNTVLIATAAVLEYFFLGWAERSTNVRYEKIELIAPERRQELLEDLRKRLGCDVRRVAIGKIDFMRDIADIVVFYRPPPKKEKQTKGD